MNHVAASLKPFLPSVFGSLSELCTRSGGTCVDTPRTAVWAALGAAYCSGVAVAIVEHGTVLSELLAAGAQARAAGVGVLFLILYHEPAVVGGRAVITAKSNLTTAATLAQSMPLLLQGELAEAVARVQVERGPFVVMLDESTYRRLPAQPPLRLPFPPDEPGLADAIAVHCARPGAQLLAGAGVRAGGAGHQLLELAEHTGATVWVSRSGRGGVDEHHARVAGVLAPGREVDGPVLMLGVADDEDLSWASADVVSAGPGLRCTRTASWAATFRAALGLAGTARPADQPAEKTVPPASGVFLGPSTLARVVAGLQAVDSAGAILVADTPALEVQLALLYRAGPGNLVPVGTPGTGTAMTVGITTATGRHAAVVCDAPDRNAIVALIRHNRSAAVACLGEVGSHVDNLKVIPSTSSFLLGDALTGRRGGVCVTVCKPLDAVMMAM